MNIFLSVLRIRPFLFLWLSELFSQTAMNTMNFILILVAYSLTNSSTAVSGIVLSFSVPAIIFGIVAGVLVDRWDKKTVFLWTNVLRAVLVFFLVVWHTNLIALYALTFCVAVVTQFFIPAETPMIPVLVKRELLIPANALFSMALFGSLLIAYGLSGPFLIFFGQTVSLGILSFTFIIAAVFACAIRVPDAHDKKYANGKSREIHFIAGIKHTVQTLIRTRDVFHAFFLLVLTQVFVLLIAVLGPGYAKSILHIDVNQFPLLFVIPAVIGMAVGAYVVANFLTMRSRHKTATLGIFIAAAAIFFLPYVTHIHTSFLTISHMVIFLAFLLGFSNSLMFVPSNTLIQEHIADEIRGKMYGTLNSVASAFSLVPIIAVGGFADLFGIGNVLYSLGIIIGLIGIFRLTLGK